MSIHTRCVTRSFGVATLLGFMMVHASAAAAPSAGSEAEARARYSRGVELYNEGVYSAALIELERAQALAPHYGILHSIALVKMQLADFVGALAAFEEYLASGGDEVSPQRKTEIRDKVAQLQERVGTIELLVNMEGAEVTLDEIIVGLTPLPKPIRVNPGKHEVSARRPGEKGVSKKVSVAGGDKLKVSFDLTGAGKATEPSEKTVTTDAGRPKWLLSSWIAAGVFAAGATVTGIVALNKASDLKDRREGGPSNARDLNELGTEVKTWGVVTDVLIVPAVVLTAVSLYFTFKPTKTTTTETPSVGFKPRVDIGLGRVGLSGTF